MKKYSHTTGLIFPHATEELEQQRLKDKIKSQNELLTRQQKLNNENLQEIRKKDNEIASLKI